MNHTDLLAAFEGLSQPRLLVVGDLILDRYTWGNAERISQEAPVIVLRSDQRESRLGGATNVCNMLRGLEADVSYAGVVGNDIEGAIATQLLVDGAIDVTGLFIDEGRITTTKERFIGRAHGRHPHQLLRVDQEVRDPLEATLEARLTEHIVRQLGEHDAVLISDYDKGVCTPTLLRRVIDAAREAGLPVLVDPIRGEDYSRYHGATTMTPNRTEASLGSGIDIKTLDDAIRAGAQLSHDLGLDMCIVTLDRDGMALVTADGQGEIFPTHPRAVYDVTGAGDMVIAMLGLALACGLSPAEAVRLGNVAGGLEVEKLGVAIVSRPEIRDRLLADQFAFQIRHFPPATSTNSPQRESNQQYRRTA